MGEDEPTRRHWPLSRRQFIGATSTAAVAGCLSINTGDEPRFLEFVVARPPLTLDPLAVWDAGSAHVVNQVVECLYSYDTDLALTPELAATQPEISRDGQRYIVTIDDNAEFPGGESVLAEDVVYSYTAPRVEPTPPGQTFDMIETVEVIDERTVQFDLIYPYQAFPGVLNWYIVPQTTAATDLGNTDDQDESARLIGSGPFRFDQRLEDGGVRLTRWDNYWRDPIPAVDGVEFRPETEGTKRVVTVKASEADVIDEIPPSVWETLSDLEAVRLDSTPGLGYYFLAFNCQTGPTTDPRVREAIDYAVDLDQAVDDAVPPIGDRIAGPVPPQVADEWSFPTENWTEIPHDQDIEQAATMLEASDAVPPDWEARLITPPDDTRQQLCEAVAAGIRSAGYRARVDRLDWATFRDTYTSGEASDYNMYCLGWIDAPDPDRYLYPLFGPAAAGRTDGTYYTRIADTVQAAREADSHTRRHTLYVTAIETMLEDRAHLPLYTERQTLGMVPAVDDMGTHPLDGFVLVGNGYNVTITPDT